MNTETQNAGALAALNRLHVLSEVSVDTEVDGTFIPLPIEEFLAVLADAKTGLVDLMKSAEPFARHNSSEPTFTVTHLDSSDVARLRAALARVGGAG